MVQGELPTIDTGGEISSPNVPSWTGGTKSKSKYYIQRLKCYEMQGNAVPHLHYIIFGVPPPQIP